jgi:hypothetical protein
MVFDKKWKATNGLYPGHQSLFFEYGRNYRLVEKRIAASLKESIGEGGPLLRYGIE